MPNIGYENNFSDIRSIVHVNEKFGQFGGTEEYIASLASLVSSLGIKSHIFYEHLHGNVPSFINKYAVIPGLGSRDIVKNIDVKLLHSMLPIEPDIVYIHNIFNSQVINLLDIPERDYLLLWYIHDHYPTCLTELRALNNSSVPTCYEVLSKKCLSNINTGTCVKRYTDRSYTINDLFSRLSLLKSARQVDAIIVVSNFMKKIIASNIPDLESRIHVLPRQIRKTSSSYKRGKKGIDNGWTIAYGGRIAYEKGLHMVIKALAELKLNDNIHFRIAGPLENEAYWSHCISLAKEAESQNPFLRIIYEGQLAYKDTDAFFGKADIVAVPSIWGEPLGAVAAEALNNGAAVVAFNVGGIDTWVRNEETGLLIEPENISALSRGLKRLLTDEMLRNRLAVSGKRLIERHFNGDEHLKAFCKVIHKLQVQNNKYDVLQDCCVDMRQLYKKRSIYT